MWVEMVVCDLCLKEIEEKGRMPKIHIHTQYACKAWQEKEIDMCVDCLKELKEKINQTEADFYKKKKEVRSNG